MRVMVVMGGLEPPTPAL